MKRSAIDYASFLLSRRPQSRFELEQKLTRKKYQPEEIEETLTHLTEVGLIDDARFAKSYAHDKLEFSRRGRYRISLELYKKGVDKELITSSLQHISDQDELAIAKELLQSRQRQWANLDDITQKRRAISLLQRRGFSPKVIRILTQKGATSLEVAEDES